MSGRLGKIGEEQVLAATSQDDVEIEPLSGKPFFHAVMLKTQVNSPYQLLLPAKFFRILPSQIIPVILLYGSRSWEMNYFGSALKHKRFDSRWRLFVDDNKLKIGDVCVFELMECKDTIIKFKVQVLRGDFPSVLLDKRGGTCKNPVVIDDE